VEKVSVIDQLLLFSVTAEMRLSHLTRSSHLELKRRAYVALAFVKMLLLHLTKKCNSRVRQRTRGSQPLRSKAFYGRM